MSFRSSTSTTRKDGVQVTTARDDSGAEDMDDVLDDVQDVEYVDFEPSTHDDDVDADGYYVDEDED
jgi:hypothetical protein